jgi:hypothetical protein
VSSSSTPSATTRNPSRRARSIVDAAMTASLESSAMCVMKLLSILISLIGRFFRCARLECPVP